MIDIIQIYKAKEIFTKKTYTPENRKKFQDIEVLIESTQGFLNNQTLVLPLSYKSIPDVKTASLIIIQDWESFMVNKVFESLDLPEWFQQSRKDYFTSDNKSLYALRQLNTPKSFEFFQIRKTENESFELFIDYGSNKANIGIPERQNHKICDLKISKPIRFKINGKSDFTMSGYGKERTFYEFDFIIEWIGKANEIEFRELNKLSHPKIIPLDKCKLIDERKILK